MIGDISGMGLIKHAAVDLIKNIRKERE